MRTNMRTVREAVTVRNDAHLEEEQPDRECRDSVCRMEAARNSTLMQNWWSLLSSNQR